MHRFGAFLEIFKVVAIVFVCAFIIRFFFVQPFVVEGSSMEPDFHDGEYILIEKFGYRVHEPKRGDVIVFHYPNNPSIAYIKRIVGLPGETVQISGGKVSVNGTPLSEMYLAQSEVTYVAKDPDQPYEVTLGSEQFFVMGDNRQHSSDSREWGPLHKRFIIGRSALVLYPSDQFQAIASPKY